MCFIGFINVYGLSTKTKSRRRFQTTQKKIVLETREKYPSRFVSENLKTESRNLITGRTCSQKNDESVKDRQAFRSRAGIDTDEL